MTWDGERDYQKTRAVKIRSGSQMAKLLGAFYWADKTDEEAATRVGISLRSDYATRCSELRRAGLIEDTGRTIDGEWGTRRMTSRITDLGLEVLAGIGDIRS